MQKSQMRAQLAAVSCVLGGTGRSFGWPQMRSSSPRARMDTVRLVAVAVETTTTTSKTRCGKGRPSWSRSDSSHLFVARCAFAKSRIHGGVSKSGASA